MMAHYGCQCRYVVYGKCRLNIILVENKQRLVVLSYKKYLFCKNHGATEDAAVMCMMMGCSKLGGVNVAKWLT